MKLCIYIYIQIYSAQHKWVHPHLNKYKICIFLMITNIINGKMAKLKCIKHILNKNDKIYANIFFNISKLANLV